MKTIHGKEVKDLASAEIVSRETADRILNPKDTYEYNRKAYLDRECTHREYYRQFITPCMEATILSRITKEQIIECKAEFNSDNYSCRHYWDHMYVPTPTPEMRKAGLCHSPSSQVCRLKACARVMYERWIKE